MSRCADPAQGTFLVCAGWTGEQHLPAVGDEEEGEPSLRVAFEDKSGGHGNSPVGNGFEIAEDASRTESDVRRQALFALRKAGRAGGRVRSSMRATLAEPRDWFMALCRLSGSVNVSLNPSTSPCSSLITK